MYMRIVDPLSANTSTADTHGFRGGLEGSVESPFDFVFRGKFLINLNNLAYCIFLKYSYPYSLPCTSPQQVHFITCKCV